MSISARRLLRACEPPFILGVTKPTAANTGLNVLGVNPASLTIVGGNVTHSTDGVVFDSIRFTGSVSVRAKNVIYRNCWFNGPYSSPTALVKCTDPVVQSIVFENCKFSQSSFSSTPDVSADACLFGHDFTLYRCDLSGSIDLIDVYSGVSLSTPAQNIQILGSYLHDMIYYSPDSSHSDNQTHSDAVQVHGGATDFLMRGTNVEGTIDPNVGQASDPSVDSGTTHISGNKQYPWLVAMSAFMLSPVNTTAGVNNFIIDKNWLGGGMAVINWPRTDGVNVQITNNRWTRGSYNGDDFTVLMYAGQSATITGNYYEDTGVAYNGRKNG